MVNVVIGFNQRKSFPTGLSLAHFGAPDGGIAPRIEALAKTKKLAQKGQKS